MPMGPRQMNVRGRGAKNPAKILKRVFGYILKGYKFPFIIVVICIHGPSVETLPGTVCLQKQSR